MQHILIIDDDEELCSLLTDYLTTEGFTVVSEQDPSDGLRQALSGTHDLIILDVMMPKLSGFDVLRKLRPYCQLPVIMLTARGDDVDRIVGLELGADDYLPKPFNPRELVARMRAIARRLRVENKPAVTNAEPIRVGDVEMLLSARQVTLNGTPVELTTVEFGLLEQLLRFAGEVVTRDYLSETVLGRELSPYDRSIDVHVSGLRKKLGNKVKGVERITSVRGKGYQYARVPQEEGRR